MKSMYDDFDFDDEKDVKRRKGKTAVPAPEADAAAPEPGGSGPERDADPVGAVPAAVDSPEPGARGRITAVVTLGLLIAVIILQVFIISTQRGLNGELRKLQEEVNLEKQQRIELGSDLLKKIDGVMQKKAAGPAGTGPAAADKAVVYMTTANVNVRSGKSAKTRRVAKLKRGGIVSEVDKDGKWTRIDYGSGSGWVPGRYLSAVSTVKVKASKLSVRSEPSRKGKVLARVKRNARGAVAGYRNRYFKAVFGDVTGWVHRDYVRALK